MRPSCSIILIALCALFFPFDLIMAKETVRDHEIVPEDYFDLATIFSCQVSPDGKYAAYVESRWGRGKEGRKNDLWVVNLDSRERLRLTFDGFGPSRPIWSPDSQWIYVGAGHKRGGEEKPPYDGKRQVWRIKPEGGEPFPMTRVKKGIRQFDLSPDGKALYYTTVAEKYDDEWKDLKKEYSDLEYGHGIIKKNGLWKLDLVSWRSEEILEADRVIHEMAVSPDESMAALITTEDNELIFKEGWSRVEVLDLESGQVRNLTPLAWRKDHPSPYGWLEEIHWAEDSRALAFAISFDGYATRVYVAEWLAGTPEVREIKRPGITAHDGALQWRGRARTLCFRAEERARTRAVAISDVRNGGQGAVSVLTPGDVVLGDFSFDESGTRLAVVKETTTHMGDIFLVENGDYKRITNVNPQVDTWRLPQIELFSWTGADGDEVEGILELPPDYREGDGPLPLVVELHGGPTASTKYKLRLWIYGRALMAAKGYALISPNYHGSTGYGDEFTSKLIGRENDIEVIDIRTGIEALIRDGIADPDRIGVMGWSNGGFLTNSMITSEPDLFKAASSGAGVLDMVIQWGTEDTPGHVVNYMEGLPWEKPEAYIKGSPLYKLHRVKTPTLIHVGGDDPRVPAAHSRALYRGLHHYLNVPVELVVYPGEAHGLSTHENRLAKMKWDLAWFDKYLLEKVVE
ncbi:MAG: S9 family peptidase [Planctomycetota bacterium]